MYPLTVIALNAVLAVVQLIVVYRTYGYIKQTRSHSAIRLGWVVSAIMTTVNAAVSVAEETYFLLGLLPTTAIVWALAASWTYDMWLDRSRTSTDAS